AQAEAYAGMPSTVLDGLAEDPLLIAAGQAVLILSAADSDESELDSKELTQLHLLASKHMGAPALTALATLPPGVSLDRFAISPNLDRAACVVSAGPGLELPLQIELPNGTFVMMWPEPEGVAPLLAFASSGALLLGLGPGGGPFKFGLIDPGWTGLAVQLPVAQGFALPR
ncbi:MAG TPA: hypothetical protein VFF36_19520, partial [Planctomycetota bacterium]|nr:hypothetical protein [Planctomycetota bacterium]